jgi:hypothetical protein
MKLTFGIVAQNGNYEISVYDTLVLNQSGLDVITLNEEFGSRQK